MAKQEVCVTVRLPQETKDALDSLTSGQFLRSQVMRIVLQDFFKKSRKEQERFIRERIF